MHRFALIALLLIILAGCGAPPPAADVEATVAARVAATIAASAPTLAPAPPTPAAGKWRLETGTSSFDDSATITLRLLAEDEITGWLDARARPELLLRCLEGRTEAYVFTGMAAAVYAADLDGADVRIRIDRGEAERVSVDRSTDDMALFFRYPEWLIPQLSGAETLLFGFTPFNATPVEARFDVRGLAEVLPQLEAVCPPQPTPTPYPTAAPPTPKPSPTAPPAATIEAVSPPTAAGVQYALRLVGVPGLEATRTDPWACGGTPLEVISRANVLGETWYEVRVVEARPCPSPAAKTGDTGWLRRSDVGE